MDPRVCLDALDKEILLPLGIDQRFLRCQRRLLITKLSCAGCIFSIGLILEVMLYKIYSDHFSLSRQMCCIPTDFDSRIWETKPTYRRLYAIAML